MTASVFQSPIKVPGGGEAQRCSYPLKFDTYGRGCQHDCIYCYARSTLAFRKMWNTTEPPAVSIAYMDTVFHKAFEDGHEDKVSRLLRSGVPIRLGGMTDCFMPQERERGITRHLLWLLNRYRCAYLILTKSAMPAEAEYVDLIDPKLAYVQWSITTPFDDVAARLEPGADASSARFMAMRTLADRGIYTAARINPLVPQFPDGHFTGRPVKAAPLRVFDWLLPGRCADYGCRTLIAGFLRLSFWNIRWIAEQTGTDWTYLFNPATRHANGALHFGIDEKRYYYERLAQDCKRAGLAFSVCYDGDEHYDTFRYLWANRDDCCNGLGNVPAFRKTWQAWERLE